MGTKIKELQIKTMGISSRELITAMEKIKKATSDLRSIIPTRKRAKAIKGKVSPSVPYTPSMSEEGSYSTTLSREPSVSLSLSEEAELSVSPSEEYEEIDITRIGDTEIRKLRIPIGRDAILNIPAAAIWEKPKTPKKKKTIKQDPLPSILDRPKRKFKFDEE